MTLNDAAKAVAKAVREGATSKSVSMMVGASSRATGDGIVEILNATRKELGDDAHLLDELA